MNSLTGLRRLAALTNINSRSPFIQRFASSVNEDFERAKSRLNTLQEDPGNEIKLKMYALFKQATVGPCDVKKPGAFDFIAKAKWSAWNQLGGLSMDDAKKQYIAIVDELAGKENPGKSSSSESSFSKFKNLIVTSNNGVYKIVKNRPQKKNSLTLDTYMELIEALNEAGADPSVKVAVLTGAGDYYCSGNDLGNFANIPPEGPAKMAKDAKEILRKYVKTHIDFPKPLIAAVNGPAIGVSVTVLGLCDLVYASDKATFHTPFMSLGQSPEACSSLIFPRIMGYAKANELLLLGKKLTAQEAFDRNLVSEVIPNDLFQTEVSKRLEVISQLPPKSLQYSKMLLRSLEKDLLEKTNDMECERLEERWLSDECMKAVMDFMSRKTK